MEAPMLLALTILCGCSTLMKQESAVRQGKSLLPKAGLGAFKIISSAAANLKVERLPSGDDAANEVVQLETVRQRQGYAEFIRMLARQGTPVDDIGCQSHFSISTLTSPETVYEILEQYCQEFRLPMRITELDIDAEEDEQLQADYLRDLLTVAFSHPAITCITQWGFWAGNHWKPRRAIVRKDWTLKPPGVVYQDLVFNRWWTAEKGETDAGGVFKTRGFLGQYRITVTAGDTVKTIDDALRADGTAAVVQIAPHK